RLSAVRVRALRLRLDLETGLLFLRASGDREQNGPKDDSRSVLPHLSLPLEGDNSILRAKGESTVDSQQSTVSRREAKAHCHPDRGEGSRFWVLEPRSFVAALLRMTRGALLGRTGA